MQVEHFASLCILLFRLKRMTLLKMINNRYSTDMLTRHKKRESFQHYIESKTESVETLKVCTMLLRQIIVMYI